MTLREAENAVLEAADRWESATGETLYDLTVALVHATRAYRDTKASGKSKAQCYCGRTVSIDGNHLRHHSRCDDRLKGHAPTLDDVVQWGGKIL